MDGLKDTLVTIAIVAFFFLSSYIKMKKKQAEQARQRQQRQQNRPVPPMQEAPVESAGPIWQEDSEIIPETETEFTVSSTLSEEIPKNQDYFTYETYEPEIKEEIPKEETSSKESVEKNVQNIDNEIEKTPPISLDMDELYKGIIYSEILKRPYN